MPDNIARIWLNFLTIIRWQLMTLAFSFKFPKDTSLSESRNLQLQFQ